ncbi:MAG: hypothetical protein JOZ38_00055 [Candidatus Eremiobacteraeota bacterium]|nr:hypothetical protein [Candidatus Eremiobacteraeota bacterium]
METLQAKGLLPSSGSLSSEILNGLGLSDAQKGEVATILAKFATQTGGAAPTQAQDQSLISQVNALLTPAQQQLLAQALAASAQSSQSAPSSDFNLLTGNTSSAPGQQSNLLDYVTENADADDGTFFTPQPISVPWNFGPTPNA